MLGLVIHYDSLQIITGHFRLVDLKEFDSLWTNVMMEYYWGHVVVQLIGIAQGALTIAVIVAITNLQERKLASFDGQFDRDTES